MPLLLSCSPSNKTKIQVVTQFCNDRCGGSITDEIIMELSRCLFCSEHCDPQREEEQTPFSLLGRQLKAVFVLRELLRLPPEKLAEFLESSGGDNPHQWIRFCDPCGELVDNAFSLFEQKVKINRKLKKAQVEAVKKVRESQREADGGIYSVVEETREFVTNYEYGFWEDPFVAGDCEAKRRVEQLKAVKLEEEDCAEDPDYPASNDDDADVVADENKGKRKNQTCTTSPEKGDPGHQDHLSPGPGGTCPVCGKSFPTTFKLKRHLWYSSCKTGVKRQGKVLDSEKFVEESTGKIRFRCGVENCGQIFKHHSSLLYHKKRAHGGGKVQYPFRCELCGQGALKPHGLKRHQAQRHFICGVKDCGERMESQETLHAHQVDVHGREIHLFKCDECGKLWITRKKLETHRDQVHRPRSAEMRHICDQCGRTYAFKSYLQHHVWESHNKLRKPRKRTRKRS